MASENNKEKWWTPASFLQKLDVFGTNIALAYDKKYEFTSSIGGLFSLVQHLILGFIIATLVIRMINRKDINLVETTVRKDQPFTNNSASIFENRKFMIGLAHRTHINSAICRNGDVDQWVREWGNKHTSFQLKHYKNSSGFEQYTEIPLEVWNETHFPASLLEGNGIDLEYLWIPFSNLSIEGSYFTQEIQEFQIIPTYIPNDECGLDYAEYSVGLEYMELNLL